MTPATPSRPFDRSAEPPATPGPSAGSADPVGAVETHISRLFFTPDRVYKLLRPVDNAFLSFVARTDRLAAAAREYELNRRITPDVYLGCFDVVENDEVTDRMIAMRRLPAERQLDRLLASARSGRETEPPVDELLRATARHVAGFHATQPPLSGIAAAGASEAALRNNWSDNFDALAPLAGERFEPELHDRMVHLVDRYLSGRAPLFEERISGGHVRDGHGDLRAEHVFCLDDGPRLIDCLAFRDDYRMSDVLLDIAFLAMDLHRLHGPASAAAFVRYYCEFTNEHHPATLAHHYVAYRAHVRAKVAALRLRQGDPAAADELGRYLALANEHLRVGQVRLVLVGGGPGVGKSTVAEGLAARLGATWLRTDEVRHDLDDPHRGGIDPVGRDPGAGGPAPAALDQGRYRPERSDDVYRRLLAQAETLLERGESVVLDATWADDRRRVWAREVAARTTSTLDELHCRAPAELVQRRMAARIGGEDPSEATLDIAERIGARFQPWSAATSIDTAGPPDATIAAAAAAVLGLEGDEPSGHPGGLGPIRLAQGTIRFHLDRTRVLRVATGGRADDRNT